AYGAALGPRTRPLRRLGRCLRAQVLVEGADAPPPAAAAARKAGFGRDLGRPKARRARAGLRRRFSPLRAAVAGTWRGLRTAQRRRRELLPVGPSAARRAGRAAGADAAAGRPACG